MTYRGRPTPPARYVTSELYPIASTDGVRGTGSYLAGAFVYPQRVYDGSSPLAAEWTVHDPVSVDSSEGVPSPSYALSPGGYAYQSSPGMEFSGQEISFDVKLESDMNFIFGANSQGEGTSLSLTRYFHLGPEVLSSPKNNNEILYNRDNDRIYMMVRESGQEGVYVIDPNTLQVLKYIVTGRVPVSMTYDGVGSLYVGNAQSDNVAVIDTSTNQVTMYIPTSHYPLGSSELVEGHSIYVGFVDPPVIQEIDIFSKSVVDTINTGEDALRGFAYDQNGYLYVTDQNFGKILVIRVSDNAIVKRINVGGSPWEAAYHPGTGYIYVTHRNTGNIFIIDRDTQSIVKTITGLPGMKGITYDGGDYVFAADNNRLLYAVDPVSQEIALTIHGITGLGDEVTLDGQGRLWATSSKGTILYPGYHSGIATSSDWATVGGALSHEFRCSSGWQQFSVILDGNTFDVKMNGDYVIQNAPFTPKGNYIGFQSSDSSSHVDNIVINP